MARYDGALGRTRKTRLHYTCPCGTIVVADAYTGIDASADPELAERLQRGELNLARCPGQAEPRPIAVPVVYHAPASELMVLVLPDALRHRELHERAALLSTLAEDTDAPVPDYARDFRVVFGGPALRALLEGEAEAALEESRKSDEVSRRLAELTEQQTELERRSQQLEASRRDLDAIAEDLDQREQKLEHRDAELDKRAAELELALAEAKAAEADARLRAKTPAPVLKGKGAQGRQEAQSSGRAPNTEPYDKVDPAELDRSAGAAPQVVVHDENTESLDADLEPVPLEEGEVIVADQIVTDDADAAAKAGRPVTQDGETRIGGKADVAIERWIVSRDKYLKLVGDDDHARLVVCAEAAELESLVSERLGMRLQLHRLPSYPLVTLTFGSPAAVRGDEEGRLVVFFFDVADADDRGVLDALAAEFTFRLELYDTEYLPVRHRTVTAPLTENVAYILAAADAYLDDLPKGDRSFDRAIIAYDDPSYDRLGAGHPERRELKVDKLDKLAKASEVRRAVAVVRHFSRPEREGYLAEVRGYPLADWWEHRRKVLRRALAVGLWTGGTLAQVAVSEGLARSRKDVLEKMRASFTQTVAGGEHDLDDEMIEDNWIALDREAEELGLPKRENGSHSSEHAPVASGTIGTDSGIHSSAASPRRRSKPRMTGVTPVAQRSTEQLVGLLEDPDRRLQAAIELARRGEDKALGPVFNSLRRMNRGEAVRVLGFAVGFGPRAAPHLIDGMRSKKGFLRQGCALALALIGREDAVEAICDQLVSEPTEIWEEIARGLGHVGQSAVMPLAARLSGHGERARERVAWALAHIAAGGAISPIETLAAGRDPVASSVARRALELMGRAQRETAEVLGVEAPEEQTVNRAFSRSFFEAAESIRPGLAPALLRNSADVTGPAMLLDEADLIEAPELEDAEPLDESDLLPT